VSVDRQVADGGLPGPNWVESRSRHLEQNRRFASSAGRAASVRPRACTAFLPHPTAPFFSAKVRLSSAKKRTPRIAESSADCLGCHFDPCFKGCLVGDPSAGKKIRPETEKSSSCGVVAAAAAAATASRRWHQSCIVKRRPWPTKWRAAYPKNRRNRNESTRKSSGN
jgi:hypothetical protein